MDLPRWLQLALLVASVAMFAGSIAAIPVLLIRIPPDFFARPRARHALAVRILRDVAGVVLILLGAAMLVLPGQGMLTILVGVGLLDLPWKRHLVRRILRNPNVKHAVDRLRERAGRPPLDVPAPGG